MTGDFGTGQVGVREAPPALAPPVPTVPVGNRWAVIVGISRYAHSGLDLKYADRDAQHLHDLLVTPEGGNFAPERIQLLVDDLATTAGVTKAVRGFLLGAMPDDLVVLFFACHGGPDPRRPSGPLYLFTHDTEPRDVSGTAFAMDEIDRSLQQLIRAERVVIIADTCHSGGIGGGPGGRAASGAEATNRYLEAMAESKGGVALLTSAEAAESSFEDQSWGGGHGVFTHFLLQGMRGAADGYAGTPKDGIVSIGELFEYVRDQVRQATDDQQHPAIGTTRFDRGLPMAVTGDLDVEQHLVLARRLVEVGWMLDDPAPMLLAARQFAIAADLKRGLPTADAERGAALLAAGEHQASVEALRQAIAKAPDVLPAEAWLHLALAEIALGEPQPAIAHLREHITRIAPATDPWADEYLQWLERPPGRTHALIIGIGKFPTGTQITGLPGVAGDVAMVKRLLETSLGVAPEDITVCLDRAASAQRLRSALRAFRDRVGPDDSAVIYYTGHAADWAGVDDPFLITYNKFTGQSPVGISAHELVDAIDLPARAVVLILDTHASRALLDLIDERGLEHVAVLLGCGVGEMAYETSVDGEYHGLFTATLCAEIAENGVIGSYRSLLDRLNHRIRDEPSNPPQTPQLVGSATDLMFTGRYRFADLWHARQRWRPRESDRTVLAQAIEHLDRPDDALALGRVDAEHDPAAALASFERARGGARPDDVLLDIAIVQTRLLDLTAAEATARDLLTRATGDVAAALTGALDVLAGARTPIAIWVIAPQVGGVGRPDEDAVGALVATLADGFGIRVDDVVVRVRDEATTSAMRSALARLVARDATTNLVVFVGSVSDSEGTCFQLADGQLPASEVRAALAPNRGAVVALLQLQHGYEQDPHGPVVKRDLGFGAAIIARSWDSLAGLAERAGDAWSQRQTLEAWQAAAADTEIVPATIGASIAADLGPAGNAWRRLVTARRTVAADAARRAEETIRQHEARHEQHPEGYLQAGLAHAASLRFNEALRMLRTARNLYDDPSIIGAARTADRSTDRWQREAQYHYGRLQYQHGDDLYDAVASLESAARAAPDDARILFHLVGAIRAMVDRESLVRARTRARRYLELGAPYGGAAALREFVAPPTG